MSRLRTYGTHEKASMEITSECQLLSSGSGSIMECEEKVSNFEDGLKSSKLREELPKSVIVRVKIATFFNGICSLMIYNSMINVANPITDMLFPGEVWIAYWNAANTVSSILIALLCAYSYNPVSLGWMKISSILLTIGMILMPAMLEPFIDYDGGDYSNETIYSCLGLMCAGIFVFASVSTFIQIDSYVVASLFCPKGNIAKYEVIGEGVSGVIAWVTMLMVKLFPNDRRGQMNGIWAEFCLSALFTILHFIVFNLVFRDGTPACEFVKKLNPHGFVIKNPNSVKPPRAERSSFIYTLRDAKMELILLALVIFGTLSMFPTFLPYGLHLSYNQNSILMGIYILTDTTLRFLGHYIEKVTLPFWVFVSSVIFRIVWLNVTTLIPVAYTGVPGIGEFWFACINTSFNVITHTFLFTYNILMVVRATKEKNQPQLGTVITLTIQTGLLCCELYQMALSSLPTNAWGE